MSPLQIYVEKTLAIIKPDIVDKEEEIQDIIIRSGFTIVQVTFGEMIMLFSLIHLSFLCLCKCVDLFRSIVFSIKFRFILLTIKVT